MRTFLSLKTCLLSALLLCVNSIAASKIISVSDFGLKPDSRINAVPFIQKAIDACKQHPGSTLVFPKGRYDFWAQHAIEKDYYETNTYDVNPKILAVLLEQINDLTIYYAWTDATIHFGSLPEHYFKEFLRRLGNPINCARYCHSIYLRIP